MSADYDAHGRRSDDVTMAVVLHRLSALEKQQTAGFQSINDSIMATSNTFVRLDLYLSQKDQMATEIEGVKKISMWALGLVTSTAVGAILIGIITAGGGVG